jgi:hypothetical protein
MGMFDEFVKKPEEAKAEEKKQIIDLAKAQPEPSLFEEFIQKEPESTIPSSGLFDEFQENKAVRPTGMFNDLIKKESTGDTKKVVSDLLDVAKEVAIGGPMSPKLGQKIAEADVKLFGEIDPIKFRTSDFIPTPLRMLTTAGKIAQREEAGFAQAGMDTLNGETSVKDKIVGGILGPAGILFNEGFQKGVTGKAESEYREGELAQLGDLARHFDLPEPVAAIFGLTAQMALPTSLVLGKITPAMKLFTKGENLAANAVARKLLIAQFKDASVDLAATKANVLQQIIGTHLPEETVTTFLNEIHAAGDKARVAKLFMRVEGKEAAKEAAEKSGRSSFITAAHGVRRAYEETMTAPRVLDMHDGFQNYQGINARLGKALNAAETKANYASRQATHSFLQEVQKLGFDAIPEELDFKLAINSYARQGEEAAVEQLLKSKGLTEIPKLLPQEESILLLAEKYLNENVDDLSKAYTRVTGQEWIKVPNYSAPLRYIDEPEVAASKLVRRNYKHEITKDMSKEFEGRIANTRVPRSDFLNLVTSQLHDQNWFMHVSDRAELTRKFLEHPIYAKGASKETLTYWGEYLSAIQNRGSNAVNSGMSALLKQARLNLNSAVLGYRLSSIMIQPFAVFDAMAYAATRWGGKAALDILNEVGRTWINPKMASSYIKGSKALVTRQGGELAIRESIDALNSTSGTKAIRKLIPSLVGNKGLDKVDAGYRSFMSHGFKMLQEADVRTAAGVHKGLKKIMKANGLKASPEEVDFVMNLLSGSSDVTMRPLVLSRGEMQKLWFTFQTFVLNRWGLAAHDAIGAGLINAGKQRELGIKAANTLFHDPEQFKQQIKTGQYAILSGEKSTLSAAENAKRTKAILTDLRSQGFKPIHAEGVYGGSPEKSFIVPGMTEAEALELGKKYGQESVLTPKGLIYGDGSGIHAGDRLNTVFDDTATDFYTKANVGGKEIKFQIPHNFDAKVPLDVDALTKPVHPSNAMTMRLRAVMGLGLLGAAEISEQQARAGIYNLTTGNDRPPQSTAQTLMMALPNNIPYFGSILNAVNQNSSSLPPVLKTVENMIKGAKKMATADKESMRIKGALQAIQSGASVSLGIPGTSQLFDILNRMIPDEHKNIHLKKSTRQKMIARLRSR